MILNALKSFWNVGAQRLRGGGTRFAAYSVLTHLLNGVSGFFVIRWLEPLALGWWNTSQMLRIVLDGLRLGILNGMNRDYPFFIGANEPERARRTLQTGLAHTLAMVGVSQLVCLAIFLAFDRSQLLFGALLATGLAWSFNSYAQYVKSTLRTSQSFALLGRIECLVAAADTMGVLLVWAWGFPGLLLRTMVSGMVTAAAFYYFRPVRVRPRFHAEELLHMFRSGRHSFLIGYLVLISSQAERIVLLTVQDGVRLLGLYTPAIVAASFLQIVPGAIHSYYYPRVVEKMGRERDGGQVLSSILQQIKKVSLLMLPLSAGAAGGMLFLIRFFLPGYEEGLPAAMLVAVAGPFYSLRMCASYYGALLRWREYYIFAILQTTLPFALMWGLVRVMPPLPAVALGYVVSIIVSGVALLAMTVAHANKPA